MVQPSVGLLFDSHTSCLQSVERFRGPTTHATKAARQQVAQMSSPASRFGHSFFFCEKVSCSLLMSSLCGKLLPRQIAAEMSDEEAKIHAEMAFCEANLSNITGARQRLNAAFDRLSILENTEPAGSIRLWKAGKELALFNLNGGKVAVWYVARIALRRHRTALAFSLFCVMCFLVLVISRSFSY